MANPLVFQSLLNRLGNKSPVNPLLYNVPKGYSPVSDTKLTPEGTEKAINFLEQQTDKKINLSFDPNVNPSMLGYFNSFTPGGGLYNSPEQSNQRTVFMGPKGGYQTLFHEVGHARDPGLRKIEAKENQFNINTIQDLRDSDQRLRFFAETKIHPRVEAETEAQAYMGFQLPRFAAANPQLGIATQPVFNDPWFKEYPASYAQKGIDEFYGAETGANANFYKEVTDRTPVAIQVGRPEVGLNTLRLALDPNVQATQQAILDRTTQTVDERLSPYQTIPSTLRDYWKSRY